MEEKKEKKTHGKVVKIIIATFRWLGFILFESILTVLNLLIIGSVCYYFSYCFGDTPHIEADQQAVSIKKVDGFYLIQGQDYSSYYERTFPNCKIKFYNKELTIKNGDVYDGNKCVTDKVSIQRTDGGFRVYYLNKSYSLNTLTKFDGTYETSYHSIKERKDMYAKNGAFYIDKDERHEIANFFLLIFVLVVLIGLRKGLVEVTDSVFDNEYNKTVNLLYTIPSLFKKRKEEGLS